MDDEKSAPGTYGAEIDGEATVYHDVTFTEAIRRCLGGLFFAAGADPFGTPGET